RVRERARWQRRGRAHERSGPRRLRVHPCRRGGVAASGRPTAVGWLMNVLAAPGGAGPSARRRLTTPGPGPAAAVAAGLAVLAAILGWQGADAPNYLFRIDPFRQARLPILKQARCRAGPRP